MIVPLTEVYRLSALVPFKLLPVLSFYKTLIHIQYLISYYILRINNQNCQKFDSGFLL